MKYLWLLTQRQNPAITMLFRQTSQHYDDKALDEQKQANTTNG